MIASFANKQFDVSDKQIKTFENLSFDAKLITEKQDGTGGKPLTTVKGEDLSSLKLSIPLSVEFGLSPLAEYNDWHSIMTSATPSAFILGTRQFGKNKYLLNSISMTDTNFSIKGVILSCKLELSFEEYAAQGTSKSAAQNNTTSPGIKNMATDRYNVSPYTTSEKSSMKRQQLKWGETV